MGLFPLLPFPGWESAERCPPPHLQLSAQPFPGRAEPLSNHTTQPRNTFIENRGDFGGRRKVRCFEGKGETYRKPPVGWFGFIFWLSPAGFPSKVQAWGDAGMQPKGRKEPGGFVPLRTDTKPRHPGSTRGWGRDAGLRKAALRAPKGGVGRRGYPPPPGCPPRPRGPAARRGRGGPFGARLRPARGARARGSSARGSLRVWGRPGFSAAVFCVSSAGSGTRFSPGGEHGEKK